MTIKVSVDNFVRAETDRMFADLQREAGGVNRLLHNRAPADVQNQAVIRLNRDTLYSFGVVDLAGGASITVPEHGSRYVSVMLIDQDHFVRQIIHDPGAHQIAAEDFATSYAFVAARVLADATDADDLAAVAALQDQFEIDAGSSTPFELPDYDPTSFDATRDALLALAAGLDAFDRMFGRPDEVDPIRHLIGTAAGWGGLPTSEATYIGVNPQLPVGAYELRVGDVPVDAFWSISVYNSRGFFEPNEMGAYSVNSITGVRSADGSITVRFGDHGPDAPNSIPITEGWNYLVRLYQPRPEISDGRFQFPTLE